MSNTAAILKSVDNKVDAAIKSSHDHHKVFKVGTIAAFLYMTEHGQVGPLNRLINNVSETDQEGIRLFAVNIIRTFAKDKDARNSYFKYSKTDKFSLAQFKEEEKDRLASSKEMKKAVIAAGEDGLSKIPLGKLETDSDTLENTFNTNAKVANFFKMLARNGEGALALQLNRSAGDYAIPPSDIEKIAKENDPAKKLVDAKKRVDALERAAANRKLTITTGTENKVPA